MIENDEILRKELQELYWGNQKLSLPEISRKLEIPYATLHDLFEKFGIALRNQSKGLKIKWKHKKQQLRKIQKQK